MKELSLPSSTQPMLTRLRAIFDLVIMFQQKQTAMISECLGEVERREAVEEKGERRGREVCVCVCLSVCLCVPPCIL